MPRSWPNSSATCCTVEWKLPDNGARVRRPARRTSPTGSGKEVRISSAFSIDFRSGFDFSSRNFKVSDCTATASEEVQHGPIVYTQVLLVWRGIEIQLLLGPSERDPEFAIFGARTECHLVGDSIRRALEECFEGPLEVFMESLMPVDEDISEEDEASVQVEHDALVQFICNRPRMHRLQKAPNGIAFAWDFPLSRQERMEFFLVNTLAQEASEADQQELEEAQPLRQRRWSRASGRSRASDS